MRTYIARMMLTIHNVVVLARGGALEIHNGAPAQASRHPASQVHGDRVLASSGYLPLRWSKVG